MITAAMIKRIIKKVLSFLSNPIVYSLLWLRGNRDFVIGSRVQANTTKYIKLGRNVSIGRDGRFLLVSDYAGQKYEPSIVIGNNISIGNRFSALSAARIVIKDNNNGINTKYIW